jgi:hypothetical protein
VTLELAWALVAPVLLGALVLRAIGVRIREDWLSWCAWVWPCGCFVLAASLWAALVAGAPTDWWPVVPFPVGAALAWIGSRAPGADRVVAARSMSPCLKAAIAFAVSLAAFHFVVASGFPCLLGDEANLWATKAKSLFLDWPMGEFAVAQRLSPHPDYPLLNPLLQAWVYAAEGEVVHFENRWLILPFELCTVLAVAAAARRLVGDRVAAAFVVAMCLEPEHAHMATTAHADGMVGLGLVMALDGLLRERDAPHRSHRAIAAIGAAFALWSKNEATMYVGLAVAAFVFDALRRREMPRPGAAAPWMLLPVGIAIGQIAWNRWFGLQNDLFGKGGPEGSVPELFVAQFSDRALPVLQAAASVLFDPRHLQFVLLLPFLALVFAPRASLSRTLFAPTCALAGSFVVLHLIYIGSYLVLSFHLATSQLRVLYQLTPMALVWVAATARELRNGPR